MNEQSGGQFTGVGDPARKIKVARVALIVSFLILLGLGWLDFVTGYELSFFVFYSCPIGIAAWYAGRWPAIVVALGATIAWLLADYFGGVKYSTNMLYYWNSLIHFLAFIINAWTIAKIKTDLDRRHQLAAELESTKAAMRELQAQPSVCPSCGTSLQKEKADAERQQKVGRA